jgi:hypothetical protein
VIQTSGRLLVFVTIARYHQRRSAAKWLHFQENLSRTWRVWRVLRTENS